MGTDITGNLGRGKERDRAEGSFLFLPLPLKGFGDCRGHSVVVSVRGEPLKSACSRFCSNAFLIGLHILLSGLGVGSNTILCKQRQSCRHKEVRRATRLTIVPCGVAKEYRIFLVALLFLSGLDELFSGSRTRDLEPSAELEGAPVACTSFKARFSSSCFLRALIAAHGAGRLGPFFFAIVIRLCGIDGKELGAR